MAENISEKQTEDASDANETAVVHSELSGLERALTDFSKNFEKSAHRWEIMIYPAMLLFFVLAMSGFYLIYSLTQDMHALAKNVDPQMAHNLQTMAINIQSLSGNIQDMTGKITQMSENIHQIDLTMGSMDSHMSDVSQKMNTLEPLLVNISEMNMSMRAMRDATGQMSRDLTNLNHNVGRPMSKFNMLPW